MRLYSYVILSFSVSRLISLLSLVSISNPSVLPLSCLTIHLDLIHLLGSFFSMSRYRHSDLSLLPLFLFLLLFSGSFEIVCILIILDLSMLSRGEELESSQIICCRRRQCYEAASVESNLALC